MIKILCWPALFKTPFVFLKNSTETNALSFSDTTGKFQREPFPILDRHFHCVTAANTPPMLPIATAVTQSLTLNNCF